MCIFAFDLDASCLITQIAFCKGVIFGICPISRLLIDFDTDAFALLVCFRLVALAYCIAWDKVQKFLISKVGQNLKDGNLKNDVSMLFLLS